MEAGVERIGCGIGINEKLMCAIISCNYIMGEEVDTGDSNTKAKANTKESKVSNTNAKANANANALLLVLLPLPRLLIML